jgi:hypothetical protein
MGICKIIHIKIIDNRYIMENKTKIINGVEYEERGKMWEIVNTDDKTVPHVVCECGNDQFKLRYGNYSVSAICPCGIEQEVYSG